MNVRRRKLHGFLLSAGLLISFITSIALLAWHEHGLIANDRPSFFPPNDVAEGGGGGGGGGAPPRSRGDHDGGWPPVLSAYAEPSHATDAWYDGGPAGGRPNAPLLPRRTSRRDLACVAFPRVNYTSALATSRRYADACCPSSPSTTSRTRCATLTCRGCTICLWARTGRGWTSSRRTNAGVTRGYTTGRR